MKTLSRLYTKIFSPGLLVLAIIFIAVLFFAINTQTTAASPAYKLSCVENSGNAEVFAAFTNDGIAGKPAIDFLSKDITGREISLKDLKGKPVLLTFFAYW